MKLGVRPSPATSGDGQSPVTAGPRRPGQDREAARLWRILPNCRATLERSRARGMLLRPPVRYVTFRWRAHQWDGRQPPHARPSGLQARDHGPYRAADHALSAGRVFVSHEVTLAVTLAAAQARLANLIHGAALVTASREAYGEGMTMLLRVGPAGSMPGVSKLVTVYLRDLVEHEDSAVLTLRWQASGPGQRLFPALDADITLTPAGTGETRMRLDGSYRPPLGTVGERIDSAMMRRVATATIQSFGAKIAASVVAPYRANAAPGTAEVGWAPQGS